MEIQISRKRTRTSPRMKYRKIDLLMPMNLADAIDNFRASKRPIPNEADALRWLLTEALITEGFEPKEEV